MNSLFLLRERAVWLFGTVLVATGLILLLYFIALLSWQYGATKSEVLGATLRFVDHSLLRPGSVDPVLIVLPLLGAALGSLGVLIARRQATRIGIEKRRAEDRLRRVSQYGEGSRLEPYIGPSTENRDVPHFRER